VRNGDHLLLHAAFRKIRAAFPQLGIEGLISQIQRVITREGSLIIPSFSYCFQKAADTRSDPRVERFDRTRSNSRVGAVSDWFWRQPEVVRTSSATHSFAIWGRVTASIPVSNAPTSPLGEGSVLEWLAEQTQAKVLMLGTDFRAFTFGHYLEVKAPVPWADVSPWDHLGVQKFGLTLQGEQPLRELPGCARSFPVLEKYLLTAGLIHPLRVNGLLSYCIPIAEMYREALEYFRNHPLELLCPAGSCPACDERRRWYISTHS